MLSIRYVQFHTQLMKNEGWIVEDVYDTGKHTIAGITKTFFPREHDRLLSLIESGATYDQIHDFISLFYFMHFWNDLYNYIYDYSLAFKVFDFGVNAGTTTAVKLLQKTLNKYEPNRKLVVDGKFGKRTLASLNIINPHNCQDSESSFYYDYVSRLEKYYRSLWNFFRFGKGWLRRLKIVLNKRIKIKKQVKNG